MVFEIFMMVYWILDSDGKCKNMLSGMPFCQTPACASRFGIVFYKEFFDILGNTQDGYHYHVCMVPTARR